MFIKQNPLNSYQNRINFGEKVPTIHVLEVITHYPLEDNFMDGMAHVCNTMTKRNFQQLDLPEALKQCSKVILEKYPNLKYFVNEANTFFKEKSRGREESIEWGKKQLDIIASDYIDVPLFKFDDTPNIKKTNKLKKEKRIITDEDLIYKSQKRNMN